MSKWLSPQKMLDYHIVRRFGDVARRSGSSTSLWSAATCERGTMERYSDRIGSSSSAG